MAQHEVNVGARVKGRDGKKLGTVEQLIVHPGTYRIDGFILGKGILSEPKIVEADLVTATDKEGIVLSMDPDEASEAADADRPAASAGRRSIQLWVWLQPDPACTPAPISGTCRVRAAVNCRIPAVESWIFQAPIGNAATENISNLGRDWSRSARRPR